MRSLFLPALALALATPILAQRRPEITYPQLIATRYLKSARMPADFARPAPLSDVIPREKLPPGAIVRSAARSAGGTLWIVTDRGAFQSAGDRFEPLSLPARLAPHQPQIKSRSTVTAVAADRRGHLWAATPVGLYATDGRSWWQVLDRSDGVPREDLLCLHLAPNGDLWAGTRAGAWRLRQGRFLYFAGGRWLPDDRIRHIWTDSRGRVWIETESGFTSIEETPLTLRKKADHYDGIAQTRHVRRGYICEATLLTAGEPERGFRFHVSDNDGEWTSCYLAALCYRYAVTKDPAIRKRAQESLHALLELERLTGVSGFPARAVVTDAELKEGVTGVVLTDTVRVRGETDRIWFRSPVDPAVWCKGDTSSDEMDGHYFAWYLYYELVADAGEKQRIAAVVRRCTDNILKGGLCLIGHTGRKTRWGVWGPQYLNEDPNWAEQRPLNSLEILAYLKTAHHITGEARYGREYERLIRDHHYLLNTLLIRRGDSARWYNINHADDEMILRMFYLLHQLEKEPDRQRILQQSLARAWEGSAEEQGMRAERNPLFNFLYGAVSEQSCDTEAAVKTLQEWPWEPIAFAVKNSLRHDVTVKTAPGRSARIELDRVLSPVERPYQRIDHNPWQPDSSADGKLEDDCFFWLFSYWLGIYHGFLPSVTGDVSVR